jgi:6-phosphogluconolactonase
MSPDNRHAISCDLGIDKILVYRFDSANGKLSLASETALPPGAGPRHLDFHPSLGCMYVLNELDATITLFDYAAETGTLTAAQTLGTLPEGYTAPNLCAEVAVHPTGKFVYASNRGHDSLAIYSADEATGRLALVGHEPTRGKTPRHFVIDPSGTFLLAANLESDSIVVFQIDAQNGSLSYRQQVDTPRPVCLKLWNVP